MAQNTYSIRMDGDLKEKFDKVCDELGLSASAAITVFAKTVVREQRIPFVLDLNRYVSLKDGAMAMERLREEAVRNGTADMSMEEINNEIDLVRNARMKDEG